MRSLELQSTNRPHMVLDVYYKTRSVSSFIHDVRKNRVEFIRTDAEFPLYGLFTIQARLVISHQKG